VEFPVLHYYFEWEIKDNIKAIREASFLKNKAKQVWLSMV